jgi:hypothetical protein
MGRRLPRPAAAALGCALAVSAIHCAQAEVSARDGYGPNGSYQVHVELVPYLWLPAVGGRIKLGNGASVGISAGVPTVNDLTTKLNGAFIGAGLVRYGPYSVQIDLQYISASTTNDLPPGILGISRSLKISPSLIRVAPGLGYQVFNAPVAGIPTTLDAQVGFAWFSSSTTLDLDSVGPLGRQRAATVSGSGSFAQPWVGLRADIYPWPRWRFELGAMVQGFGVGGGVWGWGTTLTASWAATPWLNLIGGFRALNSGREFDAKRVIRSINFTAYGPVLGIGLTF